MFLCCYQISSQTINFNNVNSNNVLNLINSGNQQSLINSSKTAVIQVGNNNHTSIVDKSKKSDLLVRQTGDFNNTQIFNANRELENQQKVNVQGNNNYIDITGNNSNSKEMEINIRGNDKMIFVRHY